MNYSKQSFFTGSDINYVTQWIQIVFVPDGLTCISCSTMIYCCSNRFRWNTELLLIEGNDFLDAFLINFMSVKSNYLTSFFNETDFYDFGQILI